MRLGNRRGEVVTLAVATLAIGALLIGLLFRPIVDKVLPIFGGQQKTVQTENVTVKPVYIQLPPDVEHPKGQIVVASQITEKLSDFKGEEKLTFLGWIRSLSVIWFICLMIGAPGATAFGVKVLGVLKAAKNAVADWRDQHDTLHKEVVKIVQSVDLALKQYDAIVASYSTMAANTVDPTIKATNQAIVLALIDAKKAILGTMGNEQDASTKVLVGELKQQQ